MCVVSCSVSFPLPFPLDSLLCFPPPTLGSSLQFFEWHSRNTMIFFLLFACTPGTTLCSDLISVETPATCARASPGKKIESVTLRQGEKASHTTF
jgi:hypothetical protein